MSKVVENIIGDGIEEVVVVKGHEAALIRLSKRNHYFNIMQSEACKGKRFYDLFVRFGLFPEENSLFSRP